MPIRMIMRSSRANGNDPEKKPTQILYHASRKMSTLHDLRAGKNIKVKDIVTEVRKIYPRYDKYLQSKCENSDLYGVQLMPDAMDMLCRKYAPEFLPEVDDRFDADAPNETAEPQTDTKPKRSGDRHKYRCRVECRLSDDEYKKLLC